MLCNSVVKAKKLKNYDLKIPALAILLNSGGAVLKKESVFRFFKTNSSATWPSGNFKKLQLASEWK